MGGFSLKVKTKDGQHIITDFNEDTTVFKFKESLSKLTNINADKLYLLIGFPPKPLDLTNHTKSLSFYGIKNADTIIVNEKQQQEGNDNKKMYVEDDELLAKSLAAEEQPLGNDNTAGPTTLPILPMLNASAAALINSDEENKSIEKGILLKQVVPSDNSCLFTSIAYVLSGKIDTSCNIHMREIIAEHISNDKELYNEAILGKPNIEYIEWIRKTESWGGAIEVSILSSFYGIEIDVVDITNALINRFGEDKHFGLRAFLLFDGIHYDPLYLESLTGNAQRTIFPIEDEDVYNQAKLIAEEAKSSRQFTDVDKFTLKCQQCDTFIKGQTEAQVHAKITGHTSFGEI